MAITITNADGSSVSTITAAGMYIFKVNGADVTKPIVWSGDDTFNLKVGDWTPDSEGQVDKVKINKPDYISMFIPNDHYDTKDFALMCTAWPTGDAPYEEARVEGHFRIAVAPSVSDYTFHAGVPTGEAPFIRPEFYSVHESDNPPVNNITTPFFTTFPSDDRNYEHVITYSGDSSFFWDSGQDVAHKPVPAGGKIESVMSVHDWAPHGDYTGYTTVSVVGSVVHTTSDVDGSNEVSTIVAQDGYKIFIEYHTGTAIKVRVLRAKNATEELLVTKENKAIQTHGAED